MTGRGQGSRWLMVCGGQAHGEWLKVPYAHRVINMLRPAALDWGAVVAPPADVVPYDTLTVQRYRHPAFPAWVTLEVLRHPSMKNSDLPEHLRLTQRDLEYEEVRRWEWSKVLRQWAWVSGPEGRRRIHGQVTVEVLERDAAAVAEILWRQHKARLPAEALRWPHQPLPQPRPEPPASWWRSPREITEILDGGTSDE